MAENIKIIIDDEFKSLIPPLAEDELAGLEELILRDGCLAPLVVWQGKGILLDGHHRKQICDKHCVDYQVRELDFATREDAAYWIDEHQLGRRNLTPAQMSLIRGRLYNRRKAQGKRTDLTSGKIYHKFTSSEQLAKESGVSEKTIRNDGQYANAVDKLKLDNAIMNREITAPRGVVIEAARELGDNPGPERIEQAKAALAKPRIASKPAKAPESERVEREDEVTPTKPHVANNSGDNEWYTPKEYIELARQVMGGIGLDPASSDVANRVVKATQYFTEHDNGLKHDWRGNVWLNPPYAKTEIQQFADKLIGHLELGDVEQAIVLTNNGTETKWGQPLLAGAAAVCFPSSRIKFWHPEKVSAPLQGQMIIYFGKNSKRFAEAFAEVGAVLYGG